MSYVAIEDLEPLPGESWDQLKRRHRALTAGRVGNPGVKIRRTQRADYRDYREDLARFPNDPEALVDGPRALERLKDKRKREGWVFDKDWSTKADSRPTLRSGEEVSREAYKRARDKGFKLDSEVNNG